LKFSLYDFFMILEMLDFLYMEEIQGIKSHMRMNDRRKFFNECIQIMKKHKFTEDNYTTIEQLKKLEKLFKREYKINNIILKDGDNNEY